MEPPSNLHTQKFSLDTDPEDGAESEKFVLAKDSFETFSMDLGKWESLSIKVRSLLSLEDYELSFEFLDSKEMAKLNLEYRGLDKPTDVLSFPQIEFEVTHIVGAKLAHSSFHKVLGDIVLCPEVCEENAAAIGHSISREACFLMVHGILHLCGHDHIDPTQEKLMLEQQNLLMNQLTEADWSGLIEVSKT